MKDLYSSASLNAASEEVEWNTMLKKWDKRRRADRAETDVSSLAKVTVLCSLLLFISNNVIGQERCADQSTLQRVQREREELAKKRTNEEEAALLTVKNELKTAQRERSYIESDLKAVELRTMLIEQFGRTEYEQKRSEYFAEIERIKAEKAQGSEDALSAGGNILGNLFFGNWLDAVGSVISQGGKFVEGLNKAFTDESDVRDAEFKAAFNLTDYKVVEIRNKERLLNEKVQQKEQALQAEENRLKAERTEREKIEKEHTDAFRNELKTKTYYFAYDVDRANKEKINKAIKDVIENNRDTLKTSNFSITDSVTVSSTGSTRHHLTVNGFSNTVVEQALNNAVRNLSVSAGQVIEPYTQKPYYVNTQGSYSVTVSSQAFDNVNIMKRYQGVTFEGGVPTEIRQQATAKLPYNGDYKMNANKLTINGATTLKSNITGYHDTGGASNALLSALVPGLGRSRVTYGEKNGLGITALTYGLIGAGVGCKIYSNSQYKKYHAATEQSVMNDTYTKANTANKAFYACIGAGAAVWIYDIIWVAMKGSENQKAHQWRNNSQFGLYYNPDNNTTGLSYAINF
jgi:hypothetical protein